MEKEIHYENKLGAIISDSELGIPTNYSLNQIS
jgi:hypothetical protein